MPQFHYQCVECAREFERDAVRYLCPECGKQFEPGQPLRGVLRAEFDYVAIRSELNPAHPDWSTIIAVEPQYHPPWPVGDTPFFPVAALGERLRCPNLYVKNDGLNPSGSLKDRASALMVAEANRLGEYRIVTASTGNAGVALAAACAAAGREAVIFAPAAAPKAKLVQMLVHGARVIRVKGTYDDAYRLSLEYSQRYSGLNRNTGYHPLTIEGKKSVALEIFQQFGSRAPNVIFVPTGDGVVLAGVYKGFYDLQRLGWIDTLPRLIAVQSEQADSIHHLMQTGELRNASSPATVADSISVAAPSNAIMARSVLEETRGATVTVSDKEILDAQSLLARTTGVFAEPAAAAALAGLRKIEIARVKPEDSVVLLITGHGLKDIEATQPGLDFPEPVDAAWDAVKPILS